MSNISARLGLPYLMPAQAQKHVTHNEALQRLDALSQLVLEGIDVATPPAVPVDGAIYALGAAPLGAWSGQGGQLAYWNGAGWLFLDPQEGWQAWDRGAGVSRIFQAGAWTTAGVSLENLPGIGIGAASDPTNRLSVASDATLLSHDGAGHQLKLNKAGGGDTASLLYQSGFTGHAEMGLTGDNDFHVKVSADGGTWTEAVVVNAATGRISGAAVQASASDTTVGRLARADYAYGPGNAIGTVGQAGGVPTGAVIETGSNALGRYVRFADGTQMCVRTVAIPSVSATTPRDFTYPASFEGVPHFSTISINQEIAGPNASQRAALNGVKSAVGIPLRWKVEFPGYSNTDIGSVSFTLFSFGRWF